MPVSTRSQFVTTSNCQTTNNINKYQGLRPRIDQETSQFINPHNDLKEKMRGLLILYDQHKQGFGVVKDLIFSTHPSVDILNIGREVGEGGKELKELVSFGNVMKENAIHSNNMSKDYVLNKTMVDDEKENVPFGGGDLDGVVVFSGSRKSDRVSTMVDDGKENVPIGGGGDLDGVVGFSDSRKCDGVSTMARKLSMEVLSEPSLGCRGVNKENVKEFEAVLPQNIVDNGKENVPGEGDLDQFVGFSGSIKCDEVATGARNVSMEVLSVPSSGRRGDNKENVKELGGVSGKQSGEGSRILVFVRLRPMWKKEKDAGAKCCVRIENRRDVYLTEFANENDYLRLKRLRGRHLTFDASFPESTSQLEVYSTTTADLVEAVLQGRNGSVFCYGATGAGKTHTMLGTVENPGVMVLAIKDLFNKIRERSFDGGHVVHLSYLEVYNETVRDLLAPGRPLVLREDKQGIVALGLTQYKAYSTDEVMSLLQQGNHNRTTEPTRANETSSRSHAILQVMIEYHVKDASDNIVKRIGKLSLIDLAGSERALATDQRTIRSFEGANINRSLLALSSCINALVEGKKHIPYRNSKLTQLLKDSLSGACNTVMIANVSPSNLSFGETQNTLHWADRAKEIRTKICDKNEEMLQLPESEIDHARLLLKLQKENRELRMQLARQQQNLLAVQAQASAANSSSAPSKVSSQLSAAISAQANEKRRTKSSFMSRNCFTPESKRKGAEDTVRELRRTMKVLEADMERMKMNHALNIKQKDDIIRKLSQQLEKLAGKGELTTRVVTRTNLRSKEPITESLLRCPSHRFQSPAPPVKKWGFWDITTANSPFLAALNERKTRSHIATETKRVPSLLRQPGHARLKS